MTGDGDKWPSDGPHGPTGRDGSYGPDGNGHGMGERQNGSGAPDRRRVRPDGRPGGPAVGPVALETLLAAAIRGGAIDAEAEQRAVAAFRVARDAGAHGARTRRRDDWRPREQRRASRSLRATLSVFLASLALGGVAYAAIGSVGPSSGGAGDDRGRADASASAETRPSDSSAASGSGTTDRPVTAKDAEAHCRAYEQVKGRGKALDSTVWKRLVAAAGGEANVPAYCAEQLARATAESKPDKTAEPGNSVGAGANSGSAGNNDDGSSGGAGAGGNAGNDQENADKAPGKN
ncbi:hypothetical protein [Streptomyces sp. MMG1533]|uniref:hypothetical protein n=1 Tax=Streptomyces sp. MMG1533 TaxID=1415546 RepID=UPI0007C80CCA|nr:hypothetical protein [Streptomyces sp. MMG1533]